MRRRSKNPVFIIILAGLILLSGAMRAETAYPDRPVHIFLGVAPGGNADTLLRLLAGRLSEKWGQPVIVENKDGANSTIAADIVAHAPPDGYTMIMVINTHTISASQMKLNYDPVKSFVPVTFLEEHPDALLANPQVSANSLKELISYAGANPNKLNYGSLGTSSPAYLQMLLLLNHAGVKMTNVSYKGTAPALIAVVGGEIQLTFGSVSTAVEQVKAGKVKALAISSPFRVPSLPDVPTVAEAADFPGYDEQTWDGILVPRETSKAIVAKLHDDFVAVINAPELHETVEKHGWYPKTGTSEEFGDFLKKDIAKWDTLLNNTGNK